MALDDARIERYSRQLILPEVGPRGQERLAAARVAVAGTGVAAERVVAYLGAAGVGRIAADPSLRDAVDPAQPDCRIVALAPPAGGDVTVVVAPTRDDAAAALARWRPTLAAFWIAEGAAGGVPPCPRCAIPGSSAAATDAAAIPAELSAIQDALLGTVVATEVVKALLAIGTGLTGQMLVYDPATATVEATAVAARPDCGCRRAG